MIRRGELWTPTRDSDATPDDLKFGKTAYVNGVKITGGIKYYYDGDEVESVTGGWVEGFSAGTGAQSKETDHFYLEATRGNGGTAYTSRTYVTDGLIDLTNIDFLYVDWENTTESPATARSELVVSTDKTGNYSVFNAVVSLFGTLTRTVTKLYVGGLSGNHYIRVSSGVSNTTTTVVSKLKVYKIYGD
jgi:hypothetical protein